MFQILRHPIFSRLFAAQAVALLGTGLLTVALALLAYDLAGDRAGTVLGTALTIKMLAYVFVSPIATAALVHLPRKQVLVVADLLRMGVALMLPFVTQIWQIYLLIFVLQTASAVFSPAFQALIPDVLRDERDYTRALALSRLAFEMENLLSPTLAGLLLMVMSFNLLFLGTALGFLASAALIIGLALPPLGQSRPRPFRERLTRGLRIYLATPRLRGLFAISGALAAVVGFVLVNSVVLVRGPLGGSEQDVALLLAVFGAGAMLSAMAIPRLLEQVSDRQVMLGAGGAMVLFSLLYALWGLAGAGWNWGLTYAVWFFLGLGYSGVTTPSGRLLARSAQEEDRPAIYTAQFALSHACYLLAYPFAGWVGAWLGLAPTLFLLALVALAAMVAALRLWPAATSAPQAHSHPDLPPDHPHLSAHGAPHSHAVIIDDEHPHWPAAQ